MNETTPSSSVTNSEQGGRILVLEPEGQLASEITAALQRAAPAAEVNAARSLEEAQRLVAHYRPDLFVLDLDATEGAGQEFLYDLRTSHPNARAIILTAVHLPAEREKAAGLGAIHFLEKPFPPEDFIDLVHALLSPASTPEGEKFQGTLSDLHIADIIQLKCMSGSTSALEFTGPKGEKARVFFETGQVCHATAPGKEGVAAFNEIVSWKGGRISEVSEAGPSANTIDLDWQILLMEAVRKIDEMRNAQAQPARSESSPARKILVIDDSAMLLSFAKEILTEANYQVASAGTAAEGLTAAETEEPALILLDYVLPDMKSDEVIRRFAENEATAKIPIVYMSGLGSDLQSAQITTPNVIGSLNKPFTSDLLIKTVENYMPKDADQPQTATESVEESAPQEEAWTSPEIPVAAPPESEATEGPAGIGASTGAGLAEDAWWSAPLNPAPWTETEPAAQDSPVGAGAQALEQPPHHEPLPASGNTFFSGDTRFFSLNWALHAIAKQRLTGTLRSFWDKETVELLAKNGEIVLATTRDAELYCPEAPITLANVDGEQTASARAHQRETGCPFFITLARDGLILREPAMQLVQHYGQKLFAELWSARRARFVFELSDQLPDYANDVPGENDVDHWALSTLRFIQFHELVETRRNDDTCIPAYTRDGFERVQKLRLTIAEAQFASQFNGARSVAQIAKNLRLDIKFARLTLFRFLALEIVECWPATAVSKPEHRGFFQRVGRSLGMGD